MNNSVERRVPAWFKGAALLLLTVAICFPFFRDLASQSFNGDENFWIYDSYYFSLFIHGDWHDPRWQEFHPQSPPVPIGKYIIGLALGLSGRSKGIQGMSRWDWNRPPAWNGRHGAMPPPAALYAARLAMAIFGAATCLLLLGLARALLGARTGIFAALFLAYNPLMLTCCRRAMTDAPLQFFLLAAAALTALFAAVIPRERVGAALSIAALVGVDAGLAAATKLNGALAGLVFICFCAAAALSRPRAAWLLLLSVGICIATSVVIFIGLNPFLWAHPFRDSMFLFHESLAVVYSAARQSHSFGVAILNSYPLKASFVFKRVLWIGFGSTLGHWLGVPVDLALSILGLCSLARREFRYFDQARTFSPRVVLIIWVLIMFASTTAWIPVDWGRYYLPLVPCVALLTACGFDELISFLSAKLAAPLNAK